jgi:hypothetical protein
MAQRNSEYTRKARDLYETPEWCTRALVPHIPQGVRTIWEPCAGNGKMSRELAAAGYTIAASDIEPGDGIEHGDFFKETRWPDAIITNPPFDIARQVVERALEMTAPGRGFVAMLLRVDWDSAKTRRHLFADCPAWSKKLVFTKRILWIENPGGCQSPSENHAWYCWCHQHEGLAQIAYHFEAEGAPKQRIKAAPSLELAVTDA